MNEPDFRHHSHERMMNQNMALARSPFGSRRDRVQARYSRIGQTRSFFSLRATMLNCVSVDATVHSTNYRKSICLLLIRHAGPTNGRCWRLPGPSPGVGQIKLDHYDMCFWEWLEKVA